MAQVFLYLLTPLLGETSGPSNFGEELTSSAVDGMSHEVDLGQRNNLNEKLGFSTLLATMNPRLLAAKHGKY